MLRLSSPARSRPAPRSFEEGGDIMLADKDTRPLVERARRPSYDSSPDESAPSRGLPAPSIHDEMVERACRQLLYHLHEEKDTPDSPTSLEMHEDQFRQSKLTTIFPLFLPTTFPLTVFRTAKMVNHFPFPLLRDIFGFIRQFILNRLVSTESIVIALVYVERLIGSSVQLKAYNWRPIVMTALLLASKMWEDLAWWNVEFSNTCRVFDPLSVNRMEMQFCRLVDFHLHVSGALYARYLFALKRSKEDAAAEVERRPESTWGRTNSGESQGTARRPSQTDAMEASGHGSQEPGRRPGGSDQESEPDSQRPLTDSFDSMVVGSFMPAPRGPIWDITYAGRAQGDPETQSQEEDEGSGRGPRGCGAFFRPRSSSREGADDPGAIALAVSPTQHRMDR